MAWWFHFCDGSLSFLPCPSLLLMSDSEGCCLLASAWREKNATAGRDVVCVQLPTQPGCWVTDLIPREPPVPVVAGGEAVVLSTPEGSWSSVSITEQPEHLSLGFWAARESWLINWFPGRYPVLCRNILLGLMPTIVWLLKSPFRGWTCSVLWWHRWALFFNANMKGDLAEFWKRLHHLDDFVLILVINCALGTSNYN